MRCNSLEEIKALREAHDAFRSSLSSAQADFNQLAELDRQIKSFRVASNPYTWFTMEALEETWRNLQKIIKVTSNEASSRGKSSSHPVSFLPALQGLAFWRSAPLLVCGLFSDPAHSSLIPPAPTVTLPAFPILTI